MHFCAADIAGSPFFCRRLRGKKTHIYDFAGMTPKNAIPAKHQSFRPLNFICGFL